MLPFFSGHTVFHYLCKRVSHRRHLVLVSTELFGVVSVLPTDLRCQCPRFSRNTRSLLQQAKKNNLGKAVEANMFQKARLVQKIC